MVGESPDVPGSECRRDLLRNPGKAEAVTKAGAGRVLIDDGHVARQVREILAGGGDADLPPQVLQDFLDAAACMAAVRSAGVPIRPDRAGAH